MWLKSVARGGKEAKATWFHAEQICLQTDAQLDIDRDFKQTDRQQLLLTDELLPPASAACTSMGVSPT